MNRDGRGRTICFGSFELRLDSGELFKRGHKIRLQGQPFDLLVALVERPAEVVNREQLKAAIWPKDTVVDFDRGLNRAVKKIRGALGDSAAKPRFIETLHRRGYRFIGNLQPESTPHGTTGRGWEDTLSIGVLPFVNIDGSAETEYLAEGITEAITNKLSAISNLLVAPRTTMLRFRCRNIPLRRIGNEAKIHHVVTGTVAQQHNTARVQTELVSTFDGRQLWGKQYRRSVAEVGSIEAELAADVAESLQVHLTDEDRAKLHKQPHTVNADAYRFYLQGSYFWNRRFAQRALECFDQATKIDPSYPLAWAGVANAYTLYFAFQIAPPGQSVQKVKDSAAAALRIDPSTADAHACLGFVNSFYDWDWTAGEHHFRKAMDLDPHLGTAQAWFAHALSSRGRNEEALGVLTRALESEPASSTVHAIVAQTLVQLGLGQDAIGVCRKALDLDPTSALALWALGFAYANLGGYAQAITSF
ncbi:MAG: winged helix-turn-helix domain-containing protein [Acidobacteriota bacterium]|nr:winged helix-turn-helix domain-containing protein [Acidobacteriota bacterium]